MVQQHQAAVLKGGWVAYTCVLMAHGMVERDMVDLSQGQLC